MRRRPFGRRFFLAPPPRPPCGFGTQRLGRGEAEQATTNVQTVAAASEQLTANIADVSLAAGETGTAAGHVLEASGDLTGR